MTNARSKQGSERRRRLPGADAEYAVGYGKPPVASRFQPGRSGNPKGRPRRHRNLRTVLDETLDQCVTIREGERSRRLTKREALILTLVNNALKNDPKAITSLVALARAVGLVDEPPVPSHQEPITINDDALLADYVARHAGPDRQASGSATASDEPPADGQAKGSA